ncbi:MAG: hypothetical protein Q8P41_27735 [Pseudomonadota bacterium]|nr:hypothetical protein [Pseudomonadota bacterium]
MPLRLVFGLFLLPFVPLLERGASRPSDEDWAWWAALVGLGLSTLLRATLRTHPPPRFARRLFGVGVAAGWGAFLVADLHEARFAWTLLLVPVGVLLGGRRHGLPGAFVALTAIWALMIRRADNGCTGVSGWYASVLLLHPVIAVWPAPFLFSRGSRDVRES